MKRIHLISLLIFIATIVFAKSPHGDDLKIDCAVCHVSDNWKTIKTDGFNHNSTSFPLKGQHNTVSCKKCHQSLIFKEAKSTCNSCHIDIHQQTLGNDCERCHTPNSWIVNNIKQIHQQTNFPLIGTHAQIDCYACHKSASQHMYEPLKSDCFDCHSTDYNQTTDPNHLTANFPKDCSLCHVQIDWKRSAFNHNNTAFPLTGSHIGVDCKRCHSNGYTGISTECVSCHQKDYNAATNPNHITAKFPTECNNCHNTTAWQPSTFNHNTQTSFPLTGGHMGIDCINCHAGGYSETSAECVSCHLNNYNATTNPNHVTAKFSTECTTCHNTTAWQPSTFNHNTSTSFPLTGGHMGVDCIKCHASGYAGTSAECVSCHLSNYNATTDPNHVTAKFSTECTTCHNTTAWQPSTFNHNTSTSFPLTGGHMGVDCIKCHASGYTGTSTECVSCHLSNYNATTNPAHAAAKFPTDCATCHNVTAWSPSTFNHDSQYFRIYSGKHRGEWTRCTECHTNSSNFSVFSCIVCHEHSSKTSVDSHHRGVSGYVYTATSCINCHARI